MPQQYPSFTFSSCMLLRCCLHITPHSSSSSAIVYSWSGCSLYSGQREREREGEWEREERRITTTLAGGCLYFKKHLDILLHLSPITSCLRLHLSLSATLSVHPSLSLTPPLFSPTSYFCWFMVKQGVSVRPRLPLCVCEGVLLFMMPAAINHVSLRRGKTVERGKNHGRCTDDTPARRKGSRRGSCRVFSGFSSSFFSGFPLSPPPHALLSCLQTHPLPPSRFDYYRDLFCALCGWL